jgi:hypothetical protein
MMGGCRLLLSGDIVMIRVSTMGKLQLKDWCVVSEFRASRRHGTLKRCTSYMTRNS